MYINEKTCFQSLQISRIMPDAARYYQILPDTARYCHILPYTANNCQILSNTTRYYQIHVFWTITFLKWRYRNILNIVDEIVCNSSQVLLWAWLMHDIHVWYRPSLHAGKLHVTRSPNSPAQAAVISEPHSLSANMIQQPLSQLSTFT